MCGDEDRPKWGKLTLVLEGLEGTGLLGLLSGGEGSGRAEDSSEAGSSLHLGKQFDTAEWRPTYAETGPNAGVYFWIVKMMKCSWSCRRQPPATHCATLASLGFQRGDNQAKS